MRRPSVVTYAVPVLDRPLVPQPTSLSLRDGSFTLTPGQTREVRITLNLLPKSGEPTDAARATNNSTAASSGSGSTGNSRSAER